MLFWLEEVLCSVGCAAAHMAHWRLSLRATKHRAPAKEQQDVLHEDAWQGEWLNDPKRLTA
jgi:hypothetical protein